MTHMDKLIPLRAASEILGVNPRTVRRLIGEGAIEACRVGSQIRIPQSALSTYVEQHKIQEANR
jgi:excisionase family DNA binding protein